MPGQSIYAGRTSGVQCNIVATNSRMRPREGEVRCGFIGCTRVGLARFCEWTLPGSEMLVVMSSSQSIRTQITLYVPAPARMHLDAIRRRFNPEQYALISSHVTLCRDEDRPDWVAVRSRAELIDSMKIRLRFGTAVREGNLVYLPVVGPTRDFDALRARLLNDSHCRKQEPHITLVHPRNGSCNESEFAGICSFIPAELSITFRQMTLIEQIGDSPWRDLQSYPKDGQTS